MPNCYRSILLFTAVVVGSALDVVAQERSSWKETASALAFSPDGKVLAAGTEKDLKLFDPDGQQLAAFPTSGKVLSLSFSADGRRLAAAVYQDQLMRIWDVDRLKEVSVMLPIYQDNSYEDINTLGWQGDKTLITLGRRWSSTKEIRFVGVWEIGKGRHVPTIPVTAEWPRLGVSPVGTAFAFAGVDKDPVIRLWPKWTNAKDKPKLLKGAHPSMVTALAFSPNGKVLASASSDLICFWEVATGKELSRIGRIYDGRKSPVDAEHPTPQMEISCVVFSPDGQTLMVGGPGRRGTAHIQFWGVESGKETATFNLPEKGEMINSAVYAPDGKSLATSDRVMVRLWDVNALGPKNPDTK